MSETSLATVHSAHHLEEASGEADLLETYLLRYDRENTRRSYRNDLESFFGKRSVFLPDAQHVTFVHVNKYLEQLETDGYAASTLRRRLASVRGFFAWLVALGVLSANPADRHVVRRIQRSGGSDRAITVLTRDQASALIASVDLARPTGVRDKALIITLLNCVLRRSEAAAMDVAHIRMVGRHHVLDLPTTKGGAQQYVKMTDVAHDAVRNMCRHYGITDGPLWRSHSPNSRGRRLSPSSVYRIVSTAAKASGIVERVGAHTLRHTGCTLAIEAGATVQQVQAHARHKNLETTMIYVHQRDRLADSAADFIDLGTSGDARG